MVLLEPENMEGTESLLRFVKEAVNKPKRERYAGFLANTKGQKKFLAALDHDLERDIDRNNIVEALSETEWLRSGNFYSSQGAYGIPTETIRQAYKNAPWEGGWLIVEEGGKVAIYRPEGRIDDEINIKL